MRLKSCLLMSICVNFMMNGAAHAGTVIRNGTIPDVPNFTATATSSSSIELHFNTTNKNLNGYYLALEGDKAEYISAANTTYTKKNLKNATNYCFNIIGFTGSGAQKNYTSTVKACATTGDTKNARIKGTLLPEDIRRNILSRINYPDQVVRVTNLSDKGFGSLRHALQLPYPILIVFDVAGEIKLPKDLIVRNPYVYIAGQTAPSPGITLTGSGLQVFTHDVVIEHIKSRPGDRAQGQKYENRDAFAIIGRPAPAPLQTYNVILDHVSATWSVDEVVSTFYPVKNIEITNSIIAEALNNSKHPKGPHPMGLLIGQHADNVTLMGNLLAHNGFRNPVVCGLTTTLFANNVIYDPLHNGLHAYYDYDNVSAAHLAKGPTVLAATRNVMLEGRSRKALMQKKYKPIPFFSEQTDTKGHALNPGSKAFVADNLVDSGAPEYVSYGPTNFRQSVPPAEVWNQSIELLPVSLLEDYVAENVGARPKDRDSVDTRIVNSMLNNTGTLIDSQDQVGGYPRITPTSWKLNALPAKGQFQKNSGNGRTNLERWLDKYTQAVQ